MTQTRRSLFPTALLLAGFLAPQTVAEPFQQLQEARRAPHST
jgi:hypothetical protein